MADSALSKRDQALEFLDELDSRHDYLLTELDALNARIDAVLAEYTKSRQAAGQLAATLTVNEQKPVSPAAISTPGALEVCGTSTVSAEVDQDWQLPVADASTATSPANSD